MFPSSRLTGHYYYSPPHIPSPLTPLSSNKTKGLFVTRQTKVADPLIIVLGWVTAAAPPKCPGWRYYSFPLFALYWWLPSSFLCLYQDPTAGVNFIFIGWPNERHQVWARGGSPQPANSAIHLYYSQILICGYLSGRVGRERLGFELRSDFSV